MTLLGPSWPAKLEEMGWGECVVLRWTFRTGTVNCNCWYTVFALTSSSSNVPPHLQKVCSARSSYRRVGQASQSPLSLFVSLVVLLNPVTCLTCLETCFPVPFPGWMCNVYPMWADEEPIMGRNSVEFHRNLKSNSLAVAGPILKGPSSHIFYRPESGTIGLGFVFHYNML